MAGRVLVGYFDGSGNPQVASPTAPLPTRLPTVTELLAMGLTTLDYGETAVTVLADPVNALIVAPDVSAAYQFNPPVGPSGPATKILLYTSVQDLLFTVDNTTPVNTFGSEVGFPLKAGDPPLLVPFGADTVLKVIQRLATARVMAQWFK